MMRYKLLFFLCGISLFSCQVFKSNYLVVSINEDSCTEGYHRLRLKSIKTDSVYQVLSPIDKSVDRNVFEGMEINITIEKTPSRFNHDINLRESYVLFCDGKKILDKNEYFYLSKDLIDLKVVSR